MAEQGAAAGSPGIANAVVDTYAFTVVSTTATTALSAAGNADAAVSVAVTASTTFAAGQRVTLEPSTVNEELALVASIPDGTHVSLIPVNAAGWRYAHSISWTLAFVVHVPSAVIRDASTAANVLKVNADGSVGVALVAGSASVGSVGLNTGSNVIGKTTSTNDATTTTSSPATASNLVVKGSAGRLVSGVVTATGSANLLIYDNASTNSGTVLGVVPSTAAVGDRFVWAMPAANGVTAAKSTTTPVVTLAWA